MTSETRAPVKYTVLEKSLVGNEIHEAGAVVEYDGLPAENLAPTCDVGHSRHQEYLRSNKDRIAKMVEFHRDTEAAGGGVGNPEAFAAAFRKELEEANRGQAAIIGAAIAEGIAKGMAAVAAAQAPKGKAAKGTDAGDIA